MAAGAALALCLGAAALAQTPDGAAIFTRSEGLTARLGRPDGPVLPAGRMSCAGCHGVDALGGPSAPSIAWPVLSAPNAVRPAYDAAALGRLMAEGVTPAGRIISAQMPRFAATEAGVAALVAHLVALDGIETQGLGPRTINVRLPSGPAAREAMAQFNADGGAWGRQVVEGEPALLDLGAAMQALAPRLRAAEDARLADLLLASPGAITGRLDEIGPRLERLAAGSAPVVAVGPAPAALGWARSQGLDAGAARAFLCAAAALDQLRAAGRRPTRTRVMQAAATADMAGAVAVFRFENGAMRVD